MKLHITLLASALMLALPALAKEVPMNQAAAIANGVTPAAASPAFSIPAHPPGAPPPPPPVRRLTRWRAKACRSCATR